MVYKRFTVQVILRIVLLLANLVCLAFIFAKVQLFFSQLILLLILIFQIYDLIRYVTQTNQDLSRFLLAIKHADFSVNFINETNIDSSFRELHESFQQIIHSYKIVESQKESQFQYFKLIIEHVQIGIISLSEDNKIVLMNKAASAILKTPVLQALSHLQSKKPDFVQAIHDLKMGGRKLVEVWAEEQIKQLSVEVNTVLLLNEPYRIITFQDIKSEIEQKEIEAWHKLIRILTHEIMNSVTPVVSLTETMLMILSAEDGNQKSLDTITEENISDIRASLKTIQKRSGSMLHFIHDYRKLSRIPVPQLAPVKVNELFETVSRLMQGEMNKYGIELIIKQANEALVINADFKLIEQVLINLLTNSIQALENYKTPVIQLVAYMNDSDIIIEVADNGKGIDKDKLDKIFIPFYSTKEDGSGIGLSLSKQIVHLHQGQIKVYSQKGIKTVFQLQFTSGK